MKKIMSVLALALLSAMLLAHAQAPQYGSELRGSLNTCLPESDLYDYAFGVDVQVRSWLWDPVGLALGAGFSAWQVKDGDFKVGNTTAYDLGGQLIAIPVGPSVVYKIADVSDWNVTAELGVRYVFAQSDIDYRRENTGERARLDIDEGSVAILAVDYERYLAPGTSFFAGIGYQLDIDEGRIQISDLGHAPNELQAFTARIGTKIEF